MNNTIKYFLYARKSSEGEDRQVTSIDDQISEVSKLSKELNIEIVDIITESKSAKEPGRKGFNEMIKRIKNGEAQGIICWKLNRLARNSVDGGTIIHLLQKNIIQHIQTYGRDYKSSDNVIMMYVEFGMANQYVNDLSVDIKRGMRKKAERGWFPIPRLPIGYIHNPLKGIDNLEKIITDPIRYSIMKKLWKFLLTGLYSVSDIKRKADELHLVNRIGKPYSLNTFHLLFVNEFYFGYFYWNDGKGNKIRHLGKHKPIVTELEFLQVQKILRKKSKPTRKRKYTFPYRGLIACGECNGFVTAENKHQAICTHCKYKFSLKTKSFCPKCKTDISKMKNPSIIDKTYYHCTKKIKKNCSQGYITDVKIETFLENQLSKMTIQKDYLEFALKGLKRINKDNFIDNEKLLFPLKKKKTELTNRLDSLIQMRADGEITSEQLQQMKLSTNKEIETLNFKILSIENQKSNWLNMATEKFNYLLKSKKIFKKGDENIKKAIASKIGSNLILKDKSLYIIRDIALSSITDCASVYIKEKSKLEPKIPIENKGEFNDFDLLYPILCRHLNKIRTCQIDNI